MFESDTELVDWSELVHDIVYTSDADDTLQPAMIYLPKTVKSCPLLVGMHAWSSNYQQPDHGAIYAQWCIEHDWAFIYPDFRGPNVRPEATGSDLVIKDIVSAVDYMCRAGTINESRIYLVGVSGGGYTALLMAGCEPKLWAAISAWVPITNLKAWYCECKAKDLKYADDIVASCRGIPLLGGEAENQCLKRSPLTHLVNANMAIDINAGIHDGHDGSVPISHALNAFNVLAAKECRLSTKQIEYFVEKQAVPCELLDTIYDPFYGEKKVLFRRQSNNIRVSIFEGGHEIIYPAALSWLAMQKKIIDSRKAIGSLLKKY